MKMTRDVSIALAAAALIVPMSGAAQASQHQGVYLGAAAGITMPTDSETRFANSQNDIEFNTGFVGLGTVGYAWGNGLRTEAELGWRGAEVDTITGTGSGPARTGDLDALTAMFNVLYDFDLDSWIVPYVGGGIGYASLSADGIRQAINGSTIDGDEGQFAYQGIAGFEVPIDHNWSVTADYRYLAAMDATYETQTATVGAKTEYASHNILLGIRYLFGEPKVVAAPAPAPKPAPAKPVAKPAIPAVPQTYMVFFDFDQTTLTPEAERILATVAGDFKKGKPVRVHVSGHADRSGTDKYNMNLSSKRASVVKAELARLGLPEDMIVTRAAGEAEPMIPTADGVREAQNRRAEIFIGDVQVKKPQ
jgi:OmpA-OmpF porin, OOP family